MNNYSSDRMGTVLTWLGLTIVGTVFLSFALWLGAGPQAQTLVPTKGTPCVYAVSPSDIASWVDRLGGWADYRGGYWYDASGSVVGMSSAEDSDICSFVR